LELMGRVNCLLRTGIRLRTLMGMVGTLSPELLRFMGKDLIVDGTCSHCGRCIKNCPAGNIYEKTGKIRFKVTCSGCMRCVYSCPNHAISLRLMTFFPVKGGYNNNEILSSPCKANTTETLAGDGGTGLIVPPFFYEYVQNINL